MATAANSLTWREKQRTRFLPVQELGKIGSVAMSGKAPCMAPCYPATAPLFSPGARVLIGSIRPYLVTACKWYSEADAGPGWGAEAKPARLTAHERDEVDAAFKRASTRPPQLPPRPAPAAAPP